MAHVDHHKEGEVANNIFVHVKEGSKAAL